MNAFKALLSGLLAVTLASCGGGSLVEGSSAGACPPDQDAPILDATSFQTKTSEVLNTLYLSAFLKALQPDASTTVTTETQQAIDTVESLILKFTKYEGPESAITATTNDIDLLESKIAGSAYENLITAKQLVLDDISNGVSCGYQNNAIILIDSDQRDTLIANGSSQEEADTLATHNFSLRYFYSPTTKTVSKIILSSISTPKDNIAENIDTSTPFNGVISIPQDNFMLSGFNVPSNVSLGFNNISNGAVVDQMTYDDNYQTNEIVMLYSVRQGTVDLNDSNQGVVYVRVAINLATQAVEIWGLNDLTNLGTAQVSYTGSQVAERL